MTLFADGGFMMYPLTLCSMIALGVIFAKFFTLHVAHRGTDRVLEEVEEAAMTGDVSAAIEICRETPGPAGAILLAGLRRIQTRKLAAGELESSEALASAAKQLSADPTAIQLRFLQAMIEVSAEKNSTLVFPVPIDLLSAFTKGSSLGKLQEFIDQKTEAEGV